MIDKQMSFKTPNDSDDSEVSLHSDASDSPKARKKEQRKRRSAFKEYFSKQIDPCANEQGRTSPQNKTYTESLLRKRFKRLMNKSEIIQSPKVSFINAPNQSGSDDENSVKTIFPEKSQHDTESEKDLDTGNSKKVNSQYSESDMNSVGEQEDVEPAIDALEEIDPIVSQTSDIPIPLLEAGCTDIENVPQERIALNCRYLLLTFLLSIIMLSISFGAPLYFITLIIGVMTPVCINIISSKLVNIIKNKLYIKGDGPEKTKFMLPNYTKRNILEVPSVEEFQVPKTYEGWINLYPHSTYDPETYHLSDTIPIYMKIKDSFLSVYHPKNRIPKRSMYNEPELKLNPTSSFKYDLRNAKVTLLPEGLARIRCWSKKYPICIDLENPKDDEIFTNDVLPGDDKITETDKETPQDDERKYDDSNTNNIPKSNLVQEDEFKDVEDHEETSTCTRNSTSTLGDEVDLNLLDQQESFAKEDRQRILLFARGNREKYDWYVRLLSTINSVSSKSNEKEHQALNTQEDVADNNPDAPQVESLSAADVELKTSIQKTGDFELVNSEEEFCNHNSVIGNRQYFKYMGHFLQGDHKDDVIDIWKDFNFSVSNDVLWFNVLAGRVLLGILSDPGWIMKIQERIQKKLSTVKLPYFIDELECSELSLGETPPMIHRASRPVLDERGLWVDLDVSYEGLITLVLSTKLNLMKLKKLNTDVTDTGDVAQGSKTNLNMKTSAVYNSDLEDSADSSTSDEHGQEAVISEKVFTMGNAPSAPLPRKQSNKSFLKVVDQVAASKFFQHATENKFVKKALVAVSNSQLRLQLNFRGLIGELVLNIPHPPSDRLWFAFRKPPRLWLSVHPAFGERNVTFTYVTSWIEKKICQEIVKNLVLPNMEDLIIPILIPQS